MTASLKKLYGAAYTFCQANTELRAFYPLPFDPPIEAKSHTSIPGIGHLKALMPTKKASGEAAALSNAVIRASGEIDWLLTYTEDQVGHDFLERFGWFELLGPTGHFLADDVVVFIGFWGPNLRYPWHKHESIEIYSVVDGEAILEREGAVSRTYAPGETSYHRSWQPHALRTEEEPVLILAVQTGSGLNDVPVMLDRPPS